MMIKKNHKILRQSIDSTIYGPVYGQRMHVARISVAHFHSHSHNLFVVSKIDNEIKTRRKKKYGFGACGVWAAFGWLYIDDTPGSALVGIHQLPGEQLKV